MESYLLYFIVGLGVFLAKLLVQRRANSIQLAAFLLAGALGGAGAGLITGFPMPAADIPAYMGILIGLAGGLLLYWIDQKKWVSRPGLAYLTTIVPGLILAFFIYGTTYVYILLTKIPVHTRITGIQMWALFGAVGFAIGLGFTFPERWFRQRGMYSKKE